jgi:hypothetical protein
VGDYKFAGEDPASATRHEAQLSIYALAASAALRVDEVRGRLWYVDAGAVRDLHWRGPELRALERDLDSAFARLAPGRTTAWSTGSPSS